MLDRAIDQQLVSITQNYRYRLLFVTVSGAHLYGFPSPDSDYDLRGVHILPLEEVIGLGSPHDTVTIDRDEGGLHLDLVTHDIRFYFQRLLTHNGSLLDQIFSPLVVHTTPEHEELKAIAQGCITRYHSRHYLGLAASQWKLFNKQEPRRVKPLLYVYRSLLCGIHLMQTGQVQPDLLRLNEVFGLPFIDDLVKRKIAGDEQAVLQGSDVSQHEQEYARLKQQLEQASSVSALPEAPSAEVRAVLNALLLRLRFEVRA